MGRLCWGHQETGMESRTRPCPEIIIARSLAEIGEQPSTPALYARPACLAAVFVIDLLHQARTLTQAFFSRLSSRILIPLRIDKVYCLHTDITPRKPVVVPLKKVNILPPLLLIFYDSSIFRNITIPPSFPLQTDPHIRWQRQLHSSIFMTRSCAWYFFFPRICQAQASLARIFSHHSDNQLHIWYTCI